jgi:outer membrane protein assembly factor BamB
MLSPASPVVAVDDPSWGQHGGTADHTGHLDRDLVVERVRLRWQRVMTPSQIIVGQVIGSGRIFVSTGGSPEGFPGLYAFDLGNGARLWDSYTGFLVDQDPPAYDPALQVVVQRSRGFMLGSLLRCHDAASGKVLWNLPYESVSGHSYLSPTLVDGVAFVPATASGGVMKVRLSDGMDLGSGGSMGQPQEFWTPTPLGNDHLLVNTGALHVVDRATLTSLYSIPDPEISFQEGLGGQAPIVTSEGYAVLAVTEDHLVAFDLDQRNVAWSIPVQAYGQIAYDGSQLFVAVAGKLSARDPATGDEKWSWSPPSGFVRPPFVVFRDFVAVMADGGVYLIDRHTHVANVTLPLPKDANPLTLTYGDNTLLVSFGSSMAAYDVPSTPLLADGFE